VNAVETTPVSDPSDPRIEVFQGLRDRALRQRREGATGDMAGVFIAEGDVVIERAVSAGYELVSVLVDAKRSQVLSKVMEGHPVYAAGPAVIEQITGHDSYRGALACFRRRPVRALDDLLADADLRSFVIVEGVNNPTNLGVIVRCAAGLGIDALVLAPNVCDPLSRRCCRVSMGEGFTLPYAWLPDVPAGFVTLQAAGIDILAMTPAEDATPIGELRFAPTDRVGILLGAEGPGLSAEALRSASRPVSIPMSGTVDSINVGTAAAVSFFALQQARKSNA
jgi:tRNA G18 (ribose-2'-O)-methylase SpoU